MTYLLTSLVSLAAHAIEDVFANMHSHVSKNIFFITDETWDLGVLLQDSNSLCRNEVIYDEILPVWGIDEIKKLNQKW